MTAQEWIQENRYANTIPRRTVALFGKAAIEVFIVGFLLVIGALLGAWVLDLIQFSPDGVPTGWPALWAYLFPFGFRQFWCYTSDAA